MGRGRRSRTMRPGAPTLTSARSCREGLPARPVAVTGAGGMLEIKGRTDVRSRGGRGRDGGPGDGRAGAAPGAAHRALEAHATLGGCAGYFRRGPYTFDAGATALMGLQPGEPLGDLFATLGLDFEGVHDPRAIGSTCPIASSTSCPTPRCVRVRSRAAFATSRQSARAQRRFWRLQACGGRRPVPLRPRASPGCRPGAWGDLVHDLRILGCRGLLAASTSVLTVQDVLRLLGLNRDVRLPVAGRHAAAGHGPGGARDRALRQCRGLPPGLPAGDEPPARRHAGPRRGNRPAVRRPSAETCAPGPSSMGGDRAEPRGRPGAGADLRGRDPSKASGCGPARSPSTSPSTWRPGCWADRSKGGSAAASDDRGPPGAPSPATSRSTAPRCPTTRRCSTRSCRPTTGRSTTGTTCWSRSRRPRIEGYGPLDVRVATMSTHTRPAEWQGLEGAGLSRARRPSSGIGCSRPWAGPLPGTAAGALVHAEFASPRSFRRYTRRTAGAVGGPPVARSNSNFLAVGSDVFGPGPLGRRRLGLPGPGDHGHGHLGHPRRRADHGTIVVEPQDQEHDPAGGRLRPQALDPSDSARSADLAAAAVDRASPDVFPALAVVGRAAARAEDDGSAVDDLAADLADRRPARRPRPGRDWSTIEIPSRHPPADADLEAVVDHQCLAHRLDQGLGAAARDCGRSGPGAAPG